MDLSNLSDAQLIDEWLSGDQHSFEQIYNRYSENVIRFLYSLGSDYDEADEIAQKTWLKFIEGINAYQHQDKLLSWLIKITHRTWLDLKRSAWEKKKQSLEVLEVFQEDSSEKQDEVVLKKQERNLIDQALLQLAEPVRQTVLLRIDGELKFKEIAEVMECPLGTVLWRMKEAEKQLKKSLGAVK